MNNKDILKQYDETKRKKLTKEERIEIYNRFDGRCGYCGEKINIKNMKVEHIVDLRVGGTDTLDNMICACRSCNHYKSTYTLEVFEKQLQEIPNRLIRDSVIFRIALRYGLIEIKDKKVEFYFKK